MSLSCWRFNACLYHYGDVIMGALASQITSLMVVYSTVYSAANQIKHESSASLAFVWGIHRGPVNSPHKWPVTRKMFQFDDVIMITKVAEAVHDRHNLKIISVMSLSNRWCCFAIKSIFTFIFYSPPLHCSVFSTKSLHVPINHFQQSSVPNSALSLALRDSVPL